MRRGRHQGAGSDDGVTIVEMLIALTILLVCLTAIVALMSSAAVSTRIARQKAAMINAGASYLERARQTSWISVGTYGGDPEGDLGTETRTVDTFDITIQPTITWGRPEEPGSHAYKTISIKVTTQLNPNDKITEWVMSTVVNEWGLGTNPASARFTTPPGGTVVWAPVDIGVEGATNSPSRDLVSCTLSDAGSLLNGNQDLLIGTATMTGRSDTATFRWSVTSLTREGLHRISARVVDNGPTQASSDGLMLLVDNSAPVWPLGAAVVSPIASSSGASFAWTAAEDGTNTDWVTPLGADHYALTLRQQPVSANPNDYTLWPIVGSTVSPGVTAADPFAFSGLQDFSRFALVLRASSPDRSGGAGLESASSVVGTSMTGSILSGAWSAVRESDEDWVVNAVASVPSGPRFPWAGTATTSFYKIANATDAPATGTLIGTVTSTSPSWSTATVSVTTHAHHDQTLPTPFYIVAETQITPTGFGSAATVVRSCVVGPPADPTLAGPQSMPVVIP